MYNLLTHTLKFTLLRDSCHLPFYCSYNLVFGLDSTFITSYAYPQIAPTYYHGKVPLTISGFYHLYSWHLGWLPGILAS